MRNSIRKISIVFLFLLCGIMTAQKTPKVKSFGIGASASVPLVDVLAGIPKGPALFYRWGPHEITTGLDMYRWTLFGFQASYNYYLNTHVFLHTQAQYGQFGIGKQSETNYYVPSNIERYKCFLHVFGAGYRAKIAGPLSMYAIAGLGYNYYTDEVTAEYYPIYADTRQQKETYLKPMASVKIGISVTVWRNNKTPKPKKKKEEEIPWD
jgi:hypothetical protein